jgi:hypothetical protein
VIGKGNLERLLGPEVPNINWNIERDNCHTERTDAQSMKRILNNERPALFMSMIAKGKSKSRDGQKVSNIEREIF